MRLVTTVSALLVLTACDAVVSPTSAGPSNGPTATVGGSPAADVCHVGGAVLCAVNPNVTQATISQTICRSGWTATIRPPASYTDALKRQQLQQFASQHEGDPEWSVAGTEEDHRLSLDLGGAPRDPMNLSPEVHRASVLKDQDEAVLGGSQGQVCRGQLTLEQAQRALITKWLAQWPAYRTS
jgi:hypothetical protein